MNFRRASGLEEPEINFIPLIDVMLVILIFLMATTTYSHFSELKIHLPVAQAEPVNTQSHAIYLTIDAQNHYCLNKKASPFTNPTAFAGLLRQAAGSQKDPLIIVEADRKATYQSVIHAMEAARLAGFARLAFSTQDAPPPTPR
jgi:biopolymer transport protein ExbD